MGVEWRSNRSRIIVVTTALKAGTSSLPSLRPIPLFQHQAVMQSSCSVCLSVCPSRPDPDHWITLSLVALLGRRYAQPECFTMWVAVTCFIAECMWGPQFIAAWASATLMYCGSSHRRKRCLYPLTLDRPSLYVVASATV